MPSSMVKPRTPPSASTALTFDEHSLEARQPKTPSEAESRGPSNGEVRARWQDPALSHQWPRPRRDFAAGRPRNAARDRCHALLESLTTAHGVVIYSNMKAELLIDERHVLDSRMFVEI